MWLREKESNSIWVSEFKKNTLGESNINLLVLSHLHADHVSGLDALLAKTVVDTVMLPYLSPEERLVVALEETNPSGALRNFWADPISFLDRKNVGRIVLFGANEASPPEDVFGEYEQREMNIDRLPRDEKLESQINDRERQSVTRLFNKNRLLAKKHNTNLVVSNGMAFQVF